MNLFWMSVVAVLARVQKLLPAKAAIDVPLALAIAAGSGAHAINDVTTRNKKEGDRQ